MMIVYLPDNIHRGIEKGIRIMSKFFKSLAWFLFFFFAIVIGVVSSRYLSQSPDVYFPEQKAVYMAHTAGLLLHVVGAIVALILGPFQFVRRLRSGWLRPIHRWMGRVYLIGVLTGGLGGLYMAFLAYGGLPSQMGFMMLAALWLGTGAKAYSSIRNGRVDEHRAWMIRNYALTFAAVTLRTWLPLFQILGFEFLPSYQLVAWLAWVPNLIVAEIFFNRLRVARSARPEFAD